MELSITILLLTLISGVNGYKILGLFAYASHSHLSAFMPIANELVNRGHQVDLVHPYPNLKGDPKINVMQSMDVSSFKKETSRRVTEAASQSVIGFFQSYTIQSMDVCRGTLTSPNVQTLLKNGKQYDIVIANVILNECGIAIAPMLGDHLIIFSAGCIPSFFKSPAPLPYSSVPNHFMRLPINMNFQYRFINAISYIAGEMGYNLYLIPAVDMVLKELVPEAPFIHDAMNDIKLYVTNSDPITSVSRPSVPSIISLTCAHCKAPKPLPEDLETFVASSGENGFLIFGLGSYIQSSDLPQATKQAFLDAFSKLKQKVIWKFEDLSLKTPSNVYITKWMPQQDLLGHSKIRLFISHGGFLSLQEATYHAVPLIGIPVFADQPGNVAHMVENKLGGQLDLQNITAVGIYDEIVKVLNDPSYHERMKQASSILRYHNKNTVNNGVNWIEYVAQHNGARHLRPAGEQLNFFQYYLIDIIASVVLVTSFVFIIFYVLVKTVLRKLRGGKKKVKRS